jgi:signal transduction histidine kinase
VLAIDWRPTVAERRPFRSVRARITAGAVLVVALALGLGAVGTVWMLDRILTGQVASQLESELESIADMLEESGSAAAWIEDRDDDVLIALQANGRTVVNDDDALQLPMPEEERAPMRVEVDGEHLLVVGEEIHGGVLVLARSTETISGAVSTASALLAVAVPLAVALIGVVVWIVAARALAPVERIRRQVDRIDTGALDHRVPTTGADDEIDRLAGTMNRMLERIEHGYRARQRFVSDASHELRSPLAAMRQYAEVQRAHPEASQPGELADVVLEEGIRMQEIVEGLLLLARLDEGAAATAMSGVDLDDLALAEARRVRALGTATIDGRGIAPARVAGDPRLLARAMRNLVDNATRHARGTIAITTLTQAGHAVVHIDDDGAGVPERERERVFERFTRLDEARSRDAGGSGLGLAIVSEVVRAHGGTVHVETAPSGGARFTMVLPEAIEA